MPTIDFEAILRLPPDQRVNALQELIAELERLVKRKGGITVSESEVKDALGLLARAKEEIAVLLRIRTPEKKTNIDDLFFKEEKNEQPLEETVADEPAVLQKRADEQHPAYSAQEKKPAYTATEGVLPQAREETRKEYETVDPREEHVHRHETEEKPYKSKEDESVSQKRFYKK